MEKIFFIKIPTEILSKLIKQNKYNTSIILQFNHFLIVLIGQTICFYRVCINCVGVIFSEKLATSHKD